MGKICLLRRAEGLVNIWCRVAGDGDRGRAVADIILSAPVRAVVALTRQLVCAEWTQCDKFGNSDGKGAAIRESESKIDEEDQKACMSAMKRPFLSREESDAVRMRALALVLSESRIALDSLVLQAPFSRPLLASRSMSCRRIVHAVCAVGALQPGLRAATTRWTSSSLAASEDVALQHQVTRILLLYIAALRLTTWKERRYDALFTEIARGVSQRLGSALPEVVRYGMLVGEAMARFVDSKDPLTFGRSEFLVRSEISDDSCSDEDLSDIGGEENVCDVPDVGPEACSGVSADPLLLIGSAGVSGAEERSELFDWECEGDDDWASVDWLSESETSSGNKKVYASVNDANQFTSAVCSNRLLAKDYDVVRKGMSAPMSIARILQTLRDLNNASGRSGNSAQPEFVSSVLRILCDRVEDCSREADIGGASLIKAAARDIALVVLFVCPESFPGDLQEEIADVRKRTLAALVALDILEVGGSLVTDVFLNDESDLSRRLEAIALLSEGVRSVAKAEAEMRSAASAEADAAALVKAAALAAGNAGTETRRMSRSLYVRHRESQRRRLGCSSVKASIGNRVSLETAAEVLFYEVANGLLLLRMNVESILENDTPAGAVESSGNQLAAQALVTIGALVSESRVGRERDELAGVLIEVCGEWTRAGSALVRRAVAISLGSAGRVVSVTALRTGGTEISLTCATGDGTSSADMALEWLKAAAEGADPDVYVRQFAGLALRHWGEKLSCVSMA